MAGKIEVTWPLAFPGGISRNGMSWFLLLNAISASFISQKLSCIWVFCSNKRYYRKKMLLNLRMLLVLESLVETTLYKMTTEEERGSHSKIQVLIICTIKDIF